MSRSICFIILIIVIIIIIIIVVVLIIIHLSWFRHADQSVDGRCSSQSSRKIYFPRGNRKYMV